MSFEFKIKFFFFSFNDSKLVLINKDFSHKTYYGLCFYILYKVWFYKSVVLCITTKTSKVF